MCTASRRTGSWRREEEKFEPRSISCRQSEFSHRDAGCRDHRSVRKGLQFARVREPSGRSRSSRVQRIDAPRSGVESACVSKRPAPFRGDIEDSGATVICGCMNAALAADQSEPASGRACRQEDLRMCPLLRPKSVRFAFAWEPPALYGHKEALRSGSRELLARPSATGKQFEEADGRCICSGEEEHTGQDRLSSTVALIGSGKSIAKRAAPVMATGTILQCSPFAAVRFVVAQGRAIGRRVNLWA